MNNRKWHNERVHRTYWLWIYVHQATLWVKYQYWKKCKFTHDYALIRQAITTHHFHVLRKPLVLIIVYKNQKESLANLPTCRRFSFTFLSKTSSLELRISIKSVDNMFVFRNCQVWVLLVTIPLNVESMRRALKVFFCIIFWLFLFCYLKLNKMNGFLKRSKHWNKSHDKLSFIYLNCMQLELNS